MSNLFISSERKLSKIKNTGIQYIPGHTEPLIDMIKDKFLPVDNENILDLGGGGLRFAIPVASLNKKIIVIDLDESAVDIDLIYSRMRKNRLPVFTDIHILKKNIIPVVDDVFHFLDTTEIRYSLITAFRLIHFLNEKGIDRFFRLVSDRLIEGGKFVVSAFIQYDGDNATNNEIYSNSEPYKGNVFYRKFYRNSLAEKIQTDQNLGPLVHLFSEKYLNEYGMKHNLRMIACNLPSTRIVRGFVFTK